MFVPLSRDVAHVFGTARGRAAAAAAFLSFDVIKNAFDKLQCDVLPDLYTLDLLVSSTMLFHLSLCDVRPS